MFISSTFIDMQRERDVLVKQTFPALRARWRPRGVELLEIDLRWGVRQEDVESGNTVPICLAEVDRCHPYFIALLGERYGSTLNADKLSPEAFEAFPVLREATGLSLTEIEIMHGVLNDADAAKRAIFFERDPAWLDTLSTQERANYVADSAGARVKLKDLKNRIRWSGATIVPYPNPERIGAEVEIALNAMLEARFPETATPNDFTQTRRLHAAYARERCGLHIGAKSHLTQLDQWMGAAGGAPILVTGASGSGKSTLIANWVHVHRQAHPRDIIFEHYLGASPDSADPMLLMRRLWEYLNRATGEVITLPTANSELIDFSAGLANRIAQANVLVEKNGGRLLMVLDGLDKLLSDEALNWLPEMPSVKLLASGLDSKAKTAALSRGWIALEVPPLGQLQRGEFVERTLESWGRKLPPDQIDAILGHAEAGNPLFLKTVLGELRVSATHVSLVERIRHYLGARDMPDLFARMLARLEGDCAPGLVANAMPLIWASRAGLEESETVAIIGANPLDWAALRNGLGDNLRDQIGRVAFSHDFLTQAVEVRYLSSIESREAVHRKLGRRYESLAYERIVTSGGEPATLSQNILARSRSAATVDRCFSELLFHLRMGGMWDEMVASIADPRLFACLPPRSYGIGYDSGTFGGVDPDGMAPEKLAGLGPSLRTHVARSLAGAFAARARNLLDHAASFPRPWSLTAYRLRQTDPEGFADYRDTFYDFIFLASHAFKYAAKGCEESTARVRTFLSDWADVAYHWDLFSREGSDVTGLSHQLEDLRPEQDLDKLVALSDLSRHEIFAGQGEISKASRPPQHHKPHESEKDSDTLQALKNARTWLIEARPLLQRIAECFASMRWSDPASDARRFETELKELVAELPPFLQPMHGHAVLPELERYLKQTVVHGAPVPDDFHYHVVLPEPGSMWGAPQRVSECLRPGLYVTTHKREGYGDLTVGILVEPQVEYAVQ